MSVLDIFKPPPHTKEIKDPKIVKKKYTYWRIRTFYSMYAGYAFFYLSRKSFTFAMPAMALSLGLDKSQRSEEHTSELQSHSFISYAVFCLKKKNNNTQ